MENNGGNAAFARELRIEYAQRAGRQAVLSAQFLPSQRDGLRVLGALNGERRRGSQQRKHQANSQHENKPFGPVTCPAICARTHLLAHIRRKAQGG